MLPSSRSYSMAWVENRPYDFRQASPGEGRLSIQSIGGSGVSRHEA